MQKWDDVEVGSETFERVQNLDEMDHASFILMSNILASGRLMKLRYVMVLMNGKKHKHLIRFRTDCLDNHGRHGSVYALVT